MKIRKETYSLDKYLKLMKAETIRTDQDCQRLSGQWTNSMVGELIATVLTDKLHSAYYSRRGNDKRNYKSMDY